jgi:hypothetical protein
MTVTASLPVDVKAWITQRERVRWMRMRRHLAAAVAAALLLGFLVPVADSLLERALIPALVAVMLQSLARGVNARFGYLWGWIYPEPLRSTALDRFVEGFLAGARNPPPHDSADIRVRPLDPRGD